MKLSQDVISVLKNILETSGFIPFEEFTAVDSLVYKDDFIAFYSLENCKKTAEAISTDGKKFYTEIDCTFEIRLFGKSGNYCDYEEFSDKCNNFFVQSAENENLLIKQLTMGKIIQSMPLKRLTEDASLTVKILVSEDVISL